MEPVNYRSKKGLVQKKGAKQTDLGACALVVYNGLENCWAMRPIRVQFLSGRFKKTAVSKSE